MASTLRTVLAGCLISLALAACSDGGGGDRAPGVEPGPNPPNGPVEPPPPILPSGSIDAGELTDVDQVVATIIGVSIASPQSPSFFLGANGVQQVPDLDNTTLSTSLSGLPPIVRFVLVANGVQRVTGLDNTMFSTSLAKLVKDADYETIDWSSPNTRPEDPVCRSDTDINDPNNACTSTAPLGTDPEDIDDTARKVQAVEATGKTVRNHVTTEGKVDDHQPVENSDGSWSYTLLTHLESPVLLEEIHRVCLQFSLAAPTNNSCVDFVPKTLVDPNPTHPASSLEDGFYQNCDSPILNNKACDSRQIVADGSCNSCHDKLAFHGGGRSATEYCVTCHNPVTTDANSDNTVDLKIMAHRIHYGRELLSEYDKSYKIWGFRNGEHDYTEVSYPQNVIQCTRCHAGQADIDYAQEQGLPAPRAVITPDGHKWATYNAREACVSCHDNKVRHGGSSACIDCHGIQDRHRDKVEENARSLALVIESATQTGPGESPIVTFRVTRDGQPIDIQDSDIFDGKLKIGIAWDAATDFDNEGITFFDSLNIEIDAIAESTSSDGELFTLNTADATSTTVRPGQDTVGIMLFGHENFDREISAIESTIAYYPSEASTPTPRRQVVDINKCDSCHHRLAMTDTGHAGFHAAPAENPQLCVGCHGPGMGLSGQSTDFRVLIHGLHASGFRDTPYFGFDTSRVQYPGDLADCLSCHLSGTYTLPLPIDSQPLKDAGNNQYTTSTAAACGACHDDSATASHMVNSGGALINAPLSDAENTIETCESCHRTGASADVDVVHNK